MFKLLNLVCASILVTVLGCDPPQNYSSNSSIQTASSPPQVTTTQPESGRDRTQEFTIGRFAEAGMKYPGTREEYAHNYTGSFEDLVAFAENNSSGDFYFGTPNSDIRKTMDTKFMSEVTSSKFKEVWGVISDSEKKTLLAPFVELMTTAISRGGFLKGMTLEQVQVSLQEPLKVVMSGSGMQIYSGYCASKGNEDCTITYTFYDGRLQDWSRTYLPHIDLNF